MIKIILFIHHSQQYADRNKYDHARNSTIFDQSGQVRMLHVTTGMPRSIREVFTW